MLLSSNKETAAVRVVVRIRPDAINNNNNASTTSTSTIPSFSRSTLQFKTGEEYSFASVLGPDSTQQETYSVVADGLVTEALAGYNTTVLAYGQTSSGKTYTMMGTEDDEGEGEGEGIIPRLATELFDKLAAVAGEHNQVSIKVSFVEIYRERLRDLLNPLSLSSSSSHQPLSSCIGTPNHKSAAAGASASAANLNGSFIGGNPATPGGYSGGGGGVELKIREGDSKKVIVEGLSELYIHSREELIAVMRRGNAFRSIGATDMNKDSSRSHSVFTLKIVQQQHGTSSTAATTTTKGGGDVVIESKIQLVDLAGSEQVKRTGAHGDRLEEAKSINLSLSCLGNVVSALAEHSKFVPYRDSKLTRILQDSLGGTAKTCLICTVSPHASNEAETHSTLRFGTRAQKVQNVAVKNIRRSEDELERLLALAEDKIRMLEHKSTTTSSSSSSSSTASREELLVRLGQAELDLERANAVNEALSQQLDASLRERKQVELELAESTHRERMLLIDVKTARDELKESSSPGEQQLNLSSASAFNEEDIVQLTAKCARYQIMLNEAREEVDMLKKTKVDQVWLYLVETQDRLKQAEQEKAFLRGEIGALQLAVRHKQERMDALEWEHAKVKSSLREENALSETKLAALREDMKRYKLQEEDQGAVLLRPPAAPALVDSSSNSSADEDASHNAQEPAKRSIAASALNDASFMSMVDEEEE